MLKKSDLAIGDVLVDGYDYEYKILGIMEELYFLSQEEEFEKMGETFTFEELKEEYKLKAEEVDEMTVEEICDELGREIKIKKD